MSKKYIFSEKEISDIINEYQNNFIPIMTISKKYSVDGSVIRRILTENNIPIINGSPFSINYWVKRGLSIEESSIKIKEFKPCMIEYWLSRGYSEDDARFQIELHLMNTERAYITKYGEEGKELFLKKKEKEGKENSKRRIEYWLKKGFSEEESKLKLKESQSTFSKKILKIKYGEKVANEMMVKRNEKWIKTLKLKENYNEIQKKKDSNSIKYFTTTYGDDFYVHYLNKFTNYTEDFKNKIIYSLSNKDYVLFLQTIRENYMYDMDKINEFSNLKVYQYIFQKKQPEIKSDIIKQYPIKNKNSWGTTYMINGVIVRSLGEMKLYNFLMEKKIDFSYDKVYPFQDKTQYKYDFYLKKYDVYVEYAGMENIRKTPLTQKIHESYDLRILKKKQHCNKHNLKHFFSNSINEIKNFIEQLYEEKN